MMNFAQGQLHSRLRILGGSVPTLYDFDKALYFDGSSYGDMPSSFSSDSYTCSFWLRAGSNNFHNVVTGSDFAIGILVATNNNIVNTRFNAFSNTYHFPSIPSNEWLHFYFWNDGVDERVFMNGVESTTGTLSSKTTDMSLDAIGYRYNPTGRYVNGLLDDLLLSSTATSTPATEAFELYNAGAGVNPLSIIPSAEHLYRFNDNVNNDGSAGGALTMNNFIPFPYAKHTPT